MIQIVMDQGQPVEQLVSRPEETVRDVTDVVTQVLQEVKMRGDEALLEYELRFDRVQLDALEVSKTEIEQALAQCDEALLATLRLATQNIRAYHSRQVQSGYMMAEAARPGVVMGQRVLPLERVGMYVPGGTASYPSTVLMNAIPAKLAGVSELVMATPPAQDGTIAPAILAAAQLAGVDRIFKMGGSQAVAALAYGTQSVPRVDKIVGPGNVYVATAKRLVYGKVDIDMIAGPSEILIVADGKSDPRFVAADLLSQAEHDKLASAWLVTESSELAERVSQQIEEQLKRRERGEIARASIDNNGRILVVKDLLRGIELANAIAPEHLELCVDEPMSLLPLVKHASSVFLGRYTPESLGDYLAGPNHTLPTSGTARFSSPLSVEDFVKKSSFLCYTRDALHAVAEDVARFARQEGLDAHAEAATIRFR